MLFSHLNRRKFIRNTTMVGAALALPELMPKAHASVAATKYFDLSQSSTLFFSDVDLESDGAPMQSFSWNDNDYCYILQSRGADSAGSYDYHDGRGDLILNRFYPGVPPAKYGYMYLNECGHGVAMGIDSNTSPITIFTEAEADTTNLDKYGAAHGTKLMGFNFDSGATIDSGSSGVTIYDPTIHMWGYTQHQLSCSIDNMLHRIAIRYSTKPVDGTFYFQLYNLDSDWYKRNYIPLLPGYGIEMPSAPSGAGTPQGWCLYGSYIYFSYGAKETDTCPGTVETAEEAGSMLGILNLNGGTSITGYASQVGYSICEREPEGLTVRTSGPSPQLMIGVSGNTTGTSDHNAWAYYKDELVGP